MTMFLLLVMIAGQDTVGSISGTVVDESGASLPSVTVTIRNRMTGRTLTLQTAFDGVFNAQNLDPGNYSVELAIPGFTRLTFPDVQVLTGRRVQLEAALRPGATDTQMVQADATSQLDTRSIGVADKFGAAKLNGLPRGSSFLSMAATARSVNSGEIEGGLQVNGASSAESEFNIDGVAINSQIDGRPRQDASFEYLQEIHVRTAGFTAEHGGAPGGVVTAVTKSGGDEFHGQGYYYSGDDLNSGPARRLVLDRRDDRTVAYFQDEKASYSHHEPGLSIGGPIRAGRLYFFTSAGLRRRSSSQIFGFSYGTDPATIERTERSIDMFNKLSFVATPRIQGSVSWLYTPSAAKGTLPSYDGPGPNWLTTPRSMSASAGDLGFFSPQSSYSASLAYAPLNTITVSGRASFYRDNFKETGVPDSSSVTYQTSSAGLSFVPQNLQGPAGTQNFPAVQRSRFDLTRRFSGQADASFLFEAAGSHDLKAGYGLVRPMNDADISHPGRGYVQIYWDRSFTSLVTGTTGRGLYGYYEVHQQGTIGSWRGLRHSAYAQDQWSMSPRLTLHLGLRVEQETLPAANRNLQSTGRPTRIRFNFEDKVAPRAGASFDLFGDGRAKLYGSWERFFDWTKYTLMRGPFGGDTWTIRYRALDTLNVFSLGGSNMPGRDLWNPAVPDSFRARIVPAFNVETADPSLQPPSQDSISLGLEYEWGRGRILSIRYLRNNLRRTIEDLSVVVNGQEFYAYANPGEGLARELTNTTGLTAPFPYPNPARKYDAVEFAFSRMPSTGWFGDFSYTWSRLFGNYPGLASSDEIRTPASGASNAAFQQQSGSIARPASYATNSWDLDEVLFDSKGNLDPRGLLATDRTHVFRFRGGYELPWRTEVGGFFYAASGTPLTTKVMTANSLPVFVDGRGDLGRTAALSYADLFFAQTVAIDDVRRVRFEFNILNAFDRKTSRHRFEHLNRGGGQARPSSAMDLSRIDLRRGYDYRALIAASPDGRNAFDPRFNMDDLFTPGFSARAGIRFIF